MRKSESDSQLVGAVSGLVHAMSLLQQLEQLLHGDAGVRRPPQGEDLPHQHPERPAEGAESQTRVRNRKEGERNTFLLVKVRELVCVCEDLEFGSDPRPLTHGSVTAPLAARRPHSALTVPAVSMPPFCRAAARGAALISMTPFVLLDADTDADTGADSGVFVPSHQNKQSHPPLAEQRR